MILAVTGHRPEKLGGYSREIDDKLLRFAAAFLRDADPDKVILGMALGWDQAVARACILLKIPFIAAVPFPGQELRWPEQAQHRYHFLLAHADSVERISQAYGPGAMQKRNIWMVDRSDEVSALWDGSSSGTKRCVQYAKGMRKLRENLWGAWTRF